MSWNTLLHLKTQRWYHRRAGLLFCACLRMHSNFSTVVYRRSADEKWLYKISSEDKIICQVWTEAKTIVEWISNFVQLHYLICLVGGSELAKNATLVTRTGVKGFTMNNFLTARHQCIPRWIGTSTTSIAKISTYNNIKYKMNETKHFKQLLLPKGVELNKLLKQLLQMLQKQPSPWGVLIGFRGL